MGFFSDQKGSEEGKQAVRVQIWCIVIACVFVLLLIVGIILFATVAFYGLGYGVYFGFFGWVTLAVGFICAWKLLNLGILVFLVLLAINILLQVIGAIVNIVNAFYIFGFSSIAGWGVLLLIYALVCLALAAMMAYLFFLGYKLFQTLGGLENLSCHVGGGHKKDKTTIVVQHAPPPQPQTTVHTTHTTTYDSNPYQAPQPQPYDSNPYQAPPPQAHNPNAQH